MKASTLNGLAGSIEEMMSLKDRIREAMGKMSQAELARAAGVTDATVTFWLDGTTKSIKGEKAVLLERATGYRANWLITGKGPKRVEPAQQSEANPVYAGRRSGVRVIPIVGTAKMGEHGYYDEISSIPGAGDGHINIATEDPNAYGLRVKGNSMSPAIREGWYVLVEPNSAPAVGEYVLVKLKDGRRMVKELLYQRPGMIEVLSVNSGERHTIYSEDLESLQAVAAVVSPSKWKPD
jgi:phage repressor protein C with HTH and peptisase S24 domain